MTALPGAQPRPGGAGSISSAAPRLSSHDLVVVTDRLPSSWLDAGTPDAADPFRDTLRAGLRPALAARSGAARLQPMRHTVHHHDVHAWTADFLARLAAPADLLLEATR